MSVTQVLGAGYKHSWIPGACQSAKLLKINELQCHRENLPQKDKVGINRGRYRTLTSELHRTIHE